jgi:hypothetical protein
MELVSVTVKVAAAADMAAVAGAREVTPVYMVEGTGALAVAAAAQAEAVV